MGAAAVVVGVSLVIILVSTAAFILVRRRHGLGTATPKDRYLRDIREVQLEAYRQTKPGPARRIGNPPIGFGAAGGGGL